MNRLPLLIVPLLCFLLLPTLGVAQQGGVQASPSATTTPTASAAAASPSPPLPAPGGMQMVFKPDPAPTAKEVSDLKPEPRPSSLADAFIGGEDWSQYTLSGPRPAFIDGDQRMSLPMAEPVIELARLAHGTARTLVALTIWLTDQVMTFGLGTALIPVAATLGDLIQHQIIGPIRLGDVALLVAIILITWRAVSGHRVHAVRDTLIGIAVIGFGALGMATPHGPICTSLSVVAALSRFFLTVTAGAPDQAMVDLCSANASLGPSLFEPIKTDLFTAFVQEPFLALQWGDLQDDCKDLAINIVNAGYFGDSPEPRHVMSQHGCEQAASFNASAGIDRALFALLHLVMVAGWSAGMIALLIPLITAQGVGAALLIVAPVIWALGVIPGLGHQALSTWLLTGFKAAISMVLSSALLAVVLGTSVLIKAQDQRLVAIFIPTALVLALAVVKWKGKERIRHAP